MPIESPKPLPITDKLMAGRIARPWLATLGTVALLLGVARLLKPESAVPAEPPASEAAKKAPATVPPNYEKGLLPFLRQYCADCHTGDSPEGDFAFDRYRDVVAVKRDRHVWTKVLKRLKVEAMPPPEAGKPPAEARAQAVRWLEHQLFHVDCSLPQDPGRVTVRRLNRTEYNHTVRDLLGVYYDPAAHFPADDTGHGFDNLGDVLTVPPLLLEKYLEAAEAIARRANWLRPPLPNDDVSPLQAARANLKRFLPRAFRRAVPDDECERYVALAQRALERGNSFEQTMSLVLQAVLVSPHFLFRLENGRRRDAGVEMLDDFALASRLSYFLWNTMPDDELFRVAQQNRLHEPEVLKAQTLRLLKDPYADTLAGNFAGQWLGLRALSDVQPASSQFPDFDQQLRQDLRKETELFFQSVLRSNKSIYELLSGNYTFLNERLARHYGIDGVKGPEFRRVNLKDGRRAGLLTQGSILTLTSHPGRTSPVKRGEWVLTNLLGDAPPEPPPSVPTLEQTRTANPNLTLRQQMERHRADPGCATCHKVMDAIGFGLENFDPIGRWRDRDGTQWIDAKGTLPTGEVFNGPAELIALLQKRKADFSRCLTEKMLTYALGRGVEWYDKCAVDDILARLTKDDNFTTLILAIVQSAPFQMRRVRDIHPPSSNRENP